MGHSYARADIPDHGIVNPINRRLKGVGQPGSDRSRAGGFAHAHDCIMMEDRDVSTPGTPDVAIAVAELVPGNALFASLTHESH
jgi:hypothetical protein